MHQYILSAIIRGILCETTKSNAKTNYKTILSVAKVDKCTLEEVDMEVLVLMGFLVAIVMMQCKFPFLVHFQFHWIMLQHVTLIQ